VTISGVIVVLGGIGLMLVHNYAGSDGGPEGWFAAVGFGAPFVGAGLLAVIGARGDNPALCIAVGIALWPMSVVSIVLVPLLAPATIMIAAGAVSRPRAHSLWLAEPLGAALVVVFGYLVLHKDPVSWTTPGHIRFSSNIVTTFEASLSLATTSLVLVVAVAWTKLFYRPHGSRRSAGGYAEAANREAGDVIGGPLRKETVRRVRRPALSYPGDIHSPDRRFLP